MNLMKKGENSGHGYYGEENDHGDIATTSPAELDLMDSSPVDHHHPEKHITTVVEREHMFDKVVTPSDVGKLNRLVIPKQHAEKYFPLDSSTNDKGLILNFEDSNGKSWRFRYSYWNSSQSYVMTKGWSRFVKDKKLDPGDIVSFHRGKGNLAKHRLFIDWRRRPDHPPHPNSSFALHPAHPYYFSAGTNLQRSSTAIATGWSSTGPPPPGALFLRGGDHYYHPRQNANYRTSIAYEYGRSNNSTSTSIATEAAYSGNRGTGATHHHVLSNPNPSGNSLVYFRSAAISPYHQQVALDGEMMPFSTSGGREVNREVLLPSVPVVPGKAAAKRLRLFGVNMDCPISDSSEEEDEEHDNTILPSTTIGHHPQTLMVPPHLSNSVQLRLYNNGASSPRHEMQFHSDYLDGNKGKGLE